MSGFNIDVGLKRSGTLDLPLDYRRAFPRLPAISCDFPDLPRDYRRAFPRFPVISRDFLRFPAISWDFPDLPHDYRDHCLGFLRFPAISWDFPRFPGISRICRTTTGASLRLKPYGTFQKRFKLISETPLEHKGGFSSIHPLTKYSIHWSQIDQLIHRSLDQSMVSLIH